MSMPNGQEHGGYTNVDQIFETLSIAEVQSLEVDLRSQAAARRSELRLLVGESYRDLLTTADTIVEMREKTVALRRQLNVLMTACDSNAVSRKLQNLKSFPDSTEHAKETVVLSYFAHLRALVIHYIKADDLVIATRLFSLGKLLAGASVKRRPELNKRIKSVRSILISAINKCSDVHKFACSFAILESATPQSCLTYFLSLQIGNLKECDSLKMLAQTVLRIIEITREFSRLGDSFDQLSKMTLVSSVAHLPEIDGHLLKRCLTEDLLHYKPFLRIENIPPSSIDEEVARWIQSSAEQIQNQANNILAGQMDIAAVIKDAKDVHNLLDEASQASVFRSISPAIETHIQSLLRQSLTAIEETKPLLSKLVSSSERIDSLWNSKMPWTTGSLRNFTKVTKSTIRGHSSAFSAFQKAYVPAIDAVKLNLDVVSRTSHYADQYGAYQSDIRHVIEGLQDKLLQEAAKTSDGNTIIEILRTLRFITSISPVAPTRIASTSDHFRKIVPQIHLELSSRDLSAIFEHGIPLGLSPAAAGFLYELSRAVSEIGIDVVGCGERASVRGLILDEIQRAAQQHKEYAHSTSHKSAPSHALDAEHVSGHEASVVNDSIPNGHIPDEVRSGSEQASKEAQDSTENTDSAVKERESSVSDRPPNEGDTIILTPPDPNKSSDASFLDQNSADVETASSTASDATIPAQYSTEIPAIVSRPDPDTPTIDASHSAISVSSPSKEQTESSNSPATTNGALMVVEASPIDLQSVFDLSYILSLLSLPIPSLTSEPQHPSTETQRTIGHLREALYDSWSSVTQDQKTAIEKVVSASIGRGKVLYGSIL